MLHPFESLMAKQKACSHQQNRSKCSEYLKYRTNLVGRIKNLDKSLDTRKERGNMIQEKMHPLINDTHFPTVPTFLPPAILGLEYDIRIGSMAYSATS